MKKWLLSSNSLQNRRNFLRISGGEASARQARVACEGMVMIMIAKKSRFFLAILLSHATRASRSPRFRVSPLALFARNTQTIGQFRIVQQQKNRVEVQGNNLHFPLF